MEAKCVAADLGNIGTTRSRRLRATRRLAHWPGPRRLTPGRFSFSCSVGVHPRRCAAHEGRRYTALGFALVILLGVLPYHRAVACDCTSSESRLCADAIFVGEILEQDPDSGSESESESASASSDLSTVFRRFNFHVLRSLRGIDGDTVGILSDSSDCGLYGSVGDKLLVYASRDPTTGLLTTQECWVRRYSDPPLDDRPEREVEALRTLGLDHVNLMEGADPVSPPFDLSLSIGRPRPSLCGAGMFPLVAGIAGVFPIVRLRSRRASGRLGGMPKLGAAVRRHVLARHGGASLGHATRRLFDV